MLTLTLIHLTETNNKLFCRLLLEIMQRSNLG